MRENIINEQSFLQRGGLVVQWILDSRGTTVGTCMYGYKIVGTGNFRLNCHAVSSVL